MNKRSEVIRKPWEQGMNPEQLEAINHDKGPCALIACPGAGKTRVLVHRIARLVSTGVKPERILAVTFSQRAANEMETRLEELGIEGVRACTWHSLCLQIIKEDGTEWASWKINEHDASKWAVKDAIGHKHLAWNSADLAKVRQFVEVCKANLWSPRSKEAKNHALVTFGNKHDADGRPEYQLALDAYFISQEIIENKSILAFDDFLVFVARHLSDEAVRARWASRWDYILSDEYNDTNGAQEFIGTALAKDHRNYMAIGDPFQSIFSWRGSSPKYLIDFAKKWDGKTITMHRNYRSGKEIIDVANEVIRTSSKRPDMISERSIKGLVRGVRAANHDDEAEEVAKWAEQHVTQGNLGGCTVLYRLHMQSRALEEALLRHHIPYLIVGGKSFYDRKEVKDLLAYLRVASDRDYEGDAVRRCINAPFRFLGAAFVDRVTKLGDERGDKNLDWSGVVQRAARQEGVHERQRKSAIEWVSIINHIRDSIESDDPRDRNPAAILKDVVDRTGYIKWLEREEGEETIDDQPGANVNELIRIAERFDTVGELLRYIEENQKAAKKQKRDKRGGDRLLLMTCHRSKALEWPHVWVVGCNEKVFPHAKGDPEEERRLMYVAMTRARDTLVTSFVANTVTKTGVKEGQASRFLADAKLIPERVTSTDAAKAVDDLQKRSRKV